MSLSGHLEKTVTNRWFSVAYAAFFDIISIGSSWSTFGPITFLAWLSIVALGTFGALFFGWLQYLSGAVRWRKIALILAVGGLAAWSLGTFGFERVSAKIPPIEATALCELNKRCEGWIVSARIDISKLPLSQTDGVVYHEEILVAKNEAALAKFCPAEFTDVSRARLISSAVAYSYTPNDANLTKAERERMEFSASPGSVTDICEPGEESCNWVQSSIRLEAGERLRIVGCKVQPVDPTKNDAWINILVRDANYNRWRIWK